jgi:hypothetical protein
MGGNYLFDYKFLKIKLSGLRRKANEDYRETIKEHEKDGWQEFFVFFW